MVLHASYPIFVVHYKTHWTYLNLKKGRKTAIVAFAALFTPLLKQQNVLVALQQYVDTAPTIMTK